MVPYKGE